MSYGDSADFSQFDIVDSKDFTQEKFALGDFSNYAEDCMGGMDEGLGKFKPKKLVKSVAKAAVKPVAQAAKIAARPMEKAVKEIARPIEKAVSKVTSVVKPVVAESNKETVISQGGALTSADLFPTPKVATVSPVVAAPTTAKISHPMLSLDKKIRGVALGEEEGLGFSLKDIIAPIKSAATQAYQTNKDKAIAAGTAQLTNVVGKTLDKLSATSPQAQATIAQVVGTATQAAQQTAVESLKTKLDQNKKYIYMAGAGIAALIVLKMIAAKRKA